MLYGGLLFEHMNMSDFTLQISGTIQFFSTSYRWGSLTGSIPHSTTTK